MLDIGAAAGQAQEAQVIAANAVMHEVRVKHRFTVQGWREIDGERVLLWTEVFDNLVTNAGRARYLDAALKTGLASPAPVVGLVVGPGGSNTYANADTMASHAGWTESSTYSQATRPAWTPGSITGTTTASVDNTSSVATFSINGSVTIAGCFLCEGNNTKGGSTGTLMGVGNFSIDRVQISGDTITAAITVTMS